MGNIEKKPGKYSILMIGTLPPPVHGSAMMTQYIKDSELINDKFKLDWVNLSTSRSMDEIGVFSPKKILRFASSYLKTFFKLCTHRYKFCYLAITCHGSGFLKDAPFALLCKLFGHKIVIHQHNKGMSNDTNNALYRFLFKLVYRNAKVILLSGRLYPDISEIVNHDQVVICPNGIPEVTKYPKHKNQIPKLLFLSNLIESKGVYVLLDACKILKEKGYVFTCDFVGGETQEINREKFNQEVKVRGLDDIIVYVGSKYGKEKHKKIADSDILVFPTSYDNECFPLVLLEAMQQGTPTISTPIGGIEDIVIDRKTGLIAMENYPGDLASKIINCLDNLELKIKLGENAYNHFKQIYTLDKFEHNLCEIFNSVCTKNGDI